MLWLQQNVGGTLTFRDLPERSDASPTFTVRSPSGGSLATGTGTVESVDTTLSAGPSAGATTVSVASATGITARRRYLIGGAVETGGEWITVQSVSGTTVTLKRPLIEAKASGATFRSTRVDCAVTAATVTTIARHHRIDLTYTVSAATRPVVTMGFDVVRYHLTSSLTVETLRSLDPLIANRMPAGLDPWQFIEDTWSMLLDRIAAQKDPGALVGSLDLTIPHGFLCRAELAMLGGKDYESTRDRLAQRYNEELETRLAAHPFDDDQDGVVESNERWTRTLRVSRG